MQLYANRLKWLVASLGLLWLLVLSSGQAAAANLNNRFISIPTALVNATTNHQFGFSLVSSSNVGSIVFTYCDNSPLFADPCTAPSGLNAAGASLSSQSGQIGFTIQTATASSLVIGRPALPVVPGAASYTFSNIVNPSTPNKTNFVRISTHASSDGSGLAIDQGSVAFSLTSGLAVNAFVPPFLTLCVAVTVAPDCTSSSGFGVQLGTLSPTQTKTGTSQFAAGTNDAGGYTLSLLGTTMTSGNDTIPAMTSPSVSIPGTGQFGLNLRANTSPAVGHEPDGAGAASPSTSYNQPNLFMFHSGDVIAASATSTEFNRFTVSYMVNIPPSQAPGVYSTTMTFVAFASF